MNPRRTIALIVIVALLAGLPATALADDGSATGDTRPTVADTRVRDTADDRPDFQTAKERALAAIDTRLRVLETLGEKIATNRFITEQHAGHLRGDLAPAEAQLEALRRKIEDAETWLELVPLVAQIDDHAVLTVLAPKTAQVIASDTLVALSGKLQILVSGLEAAIERFKMAGYDVAEARAMLDEMKSLIQRAESLAAPVAGAVIGLDADDWPDPAASILESGREDLAAARQAVRDARRTGTEIMHFLRRLLDSETDA